MSAEDAEISWRRTFMRRLIDEHGWDLESAKACADAAEWLRDENPEDSADEENYLHRFDAGDGDVS